MDPEQQRIVWEHVLHGCLGVDPCDCAVLVTEVPFTPPAVHRDVVEMMFEVFGFSDVCVTAGPPLAAKSPGIVKQLDERNPCCTVLDVGFSSSVAMPCIEGQAWPAAARRLNVGGRALTNLLMERLRLRHYDLSETWLVAADIAERLCEVSLDFDAELLAGFAGVPPQTYVLPDFKDRVRGFVEGPPATDVETQRPVTDADAQRVKLCNERVILPEIFFSPRDHGVSQVGVAGLIQQSILGIEEPACCPHFGQVVLCGGVARLPNFRQRLRRELRALLPAHWPVAVVAEEEPELSIWRGAAELAQNSEFRRLNFQTRSAWEESGQISGGSSAKRRRQDG